MTRLLRKFAPFALITVLVFQIACGGFAAELRLALAASGPLLDSLVSSGAINANMRAGLITDFSDLAQGAATLKSDLDACAGVKPCKLTAVEKFETLFEQIEARGHFGVHARIRQVEIILRGIISAARIYYGGTPLAMGGPAMSRSEAGEQLKAKIKELKAAMRP